MAAGERSRSAGAVMEWLLAGDPAIRWQALRDLEGAGEFAWRRERGKVAREGWGARLLAKQHEDGRWAAGRSADTGLYSPKWISTTYTMMELRDLGLPPGNRKALSACGLLAGGGLQRDGGLNYGWRGRSETCISGMGLSLFSHFGFDDPSVERIARYLLAQQMPDGGWNCMRDHGATHSSLNTTISALEGLASYVRTRPRLAREVLAAQRRGREFLLRHGLFRSHRTGEVIHPKFLKAAFPPRWHYDVLRALDHFQAAGAPRDARCAEAIDVIRSKRRPDGRWPLEHEYRGKIHFRMERLGGPSRWNTLRALRVLRWWERGGPGRRGRAA